MGQETEQTVETGSRRHSDRLPDPFDNVEGEVVRFTMTRELGTLEPEPPMPFGYRVEPFTPMLLPAYAAVLAVAFSDSPDLQYYPRLSSRDGCLSLLKEITEKQGFMPGASWLVLFGKEPAAAILSGRASGGQSGQIHVVAVAPRHRRLGVGKYLVSKCQWAFRDRHLLQAAVRVNRSNRGAVRFFRACGFQVSEARTYI